MTCAECCQTMRPLETAYTSRDGRVVCEYCAPYLRSDFERLKREMKERVKARARLLHVQGGKLKSLIVPISKCVSCHPCRQ